MEISLTDWVGYLASVIVFVSFLHKDVKKIRLINMSGALIFVIYGFMLKTAYPVIIFNVGLIMLHIYHLLKATKNE